MSDTTPYTFDDYDYIYKHFNQDGPVSVAQHLGRSVASVTNRSTKLNLLSQGAPTAEELKYCRNYGKTLGTALMFLMPNRTTVEIEEMLACLKS